MWQHYNLPWINTQAVDAYELDLASSGTNRIKTVKGVWVCLGDISSSVNPSGVTCQVVSWSNSKVSLRFGSDSPSPNKRANWLLWVVGTA